MSRKNHVATVALIVLSSLFTFSSHSSTSSESEFQAAHQNAQLAQEGLQRCLRFVNGWLQHVDPESGLIPRNLENDTDIWNAHDCGADNYPFMVLTTAMTDRDLFEGKMLDMLRTEIRLTSRLGAIPDIYSFTTNDFRYDSIDMDRLMFGGSEYIKDGLLPLTEWLGPSPWSDRMLAILDDMWQHAPLTSPFGKIVSNNVEVNGEMLQVLSRLYWQQKDPKYLEWAQRLGDLYLLGNQHPTRDFERLRLRDHGCEIVSGLCELYVTLHFANRPKKQQYQPALYDMLDRILEVGRNADGLFYNVIQPQSGEILNDGIADTWGYTLNGYYSVYLIDRVERYRDAVLVAFEHLDKYRNYNWERGSADGYADAIESALNLYNREPLPEVADWIDSQVQVMWDKQQPSGIIEGWHGDGNFARTSIMYCLWKTQGLTAHPWRHDLRFGATAKDDQLFVTVESDSAWHGELVFDTPRHQTHMNLPMDWPRINQFSEWFTVDDTAIYRIENVSTKTTTSLQGSDLASGVSVTTDQDEPVKLVITLQ